MPRLAPVLLTGLAAAALPAPAASAHAGVCGPPRTGPLYATKLHGVSCRGANDVLAKYGKHPTLLFGSGTITVESFRCTRHHHSHTNSAGGDYASVSGTCSLGSSSFTYTSHTFA